MIELYELHYTKAELAKAPEKDRLFYVMATGLANDLQTLMKLFAVAVADDRDELIIKQGGSSVAMLMLRLLASRLWEGWELLRTGYKPIEVYYEGELGPEPREALSQLRGYLSKRPNLILVIRHKIGFHADKGIAKAALSRFRDDGEMGDYLCRTIGNTLYYSAELLHYEAINGFTGEKDQAASLRRLVGDVQGLVGHFNTFIYGFAGVFLERHLAQQLEKMRDRVTRLEGVPRYDELQLPYFIELPPVRPK